MFLWLVSFREGRTLVSAHQQYFFLVMSWKNGGAQRAVYRESIEKREQTINRWLLRNSILLGAATDQPHLPLVRARPVHFPGRSDQEWEALWRGRQAEGNLINPSFTWSELFAFTPNFRGHVPESCTIISFA